MTELGGRGWLNRAAQINQTLALALDPSVRATDAPRIAAWVARNPDATVRRAAKRLKKNASRTQLWWWGGLTWASHVSGDQVLAWQFIQSEWTQLTTLELGSFVLPSMIRAVLESLPATAAMLADAKVCEWARGG